MDAKIERRDKALECAMLQVEVLNNKYIPAPEIGTKGRIEVGKQ
jgi:hypothetical protein